MTSFNSLTEKDDLCHSIFSLEDLHGIDVFLLCISVALAFDSVPGVPLCFARKVHHSRSRSVTVADSCLLEKRIELEKFIISWLGLEIFRFFGGFVESFGHSSKSVRQSKSDSKMG